MKPKYRERLTRGLAIGAAALALNGCADPVRTGERMIRKTKSSVRNTLRTVKNVVPTIPTRLRLNACLANAHPERSINLEAFRKDITIGPIIDTIKVDSIQIDCGGSASIQVYPDSCRIMVTMETFSCINDNGNADGIWDSIILPATIKPYHQFIPPFSKLLSLADTMNNPKKWQSYQDKCTDAFSQCMDREDN